MSLNTQAQIVNIPDANFKAYLVGNSLINTNGDGEIQVSEANSYSAYPLYLPSNANIIDLTGLEAFVSIKEFSCTYNDIVNIDFSQNSALKKIFIQSCDSLININITQNSALTNLFIDANNLSNLDVSNNLLLDTLNCGTSLSILDVSQNVNLKELRVFSGNMINNLDITNCPSLIFLQILGNNLNSIDVSQNPLLEILDVSGNNLNNLNINNNIKLETLEFEFNNISEIDLSNNNLIRTLWCNNNNLTSLKTPNLSSLTDLRCDFNQIDSLDVSSCMLNNYFHCNDNNLNYLNVKNGNNTLMNDGFGFQIQNNPNLYCVEVDTPSWSALNWVTFVDSQITFSSNCSCDSISTLEMNFDSISNINCLDSGYARMLPFNGIPPYSYIWSSSSNDSVAKFNIPGVYSATVTDATSCSRTKGVFIDGPSSNTNLDLSVNLITGGFRPSIPSMVTLSGINDGCIAADGQLKLRLDTLVSLVSSTPPPDLVNGDTLIWDFTNLVYQGNIIEPILFLEADSTSNIGDTICLETWITPLVGDIDTSNNHKLYCYDVVNSFDPNDKQVYPKGKCNAGYILNTQKLTYTIRFQNTGTAEAIDVSILDELSPYLDLSTFKVIRQSHPNLRTTVLKNNILEFRFDSILLPDSFADLIGSNGFLVYEIYPNSNASNNSVIENTAEIYFDNNAPVITNTVSNRVKSSIPSVCTVTSLNEKLTKRKLKVYPNPFNNSFTIEISNDVFTNLSKDNSSSISIYDLLGKKVNFSLTLLPVRQTGEMTKNTINIDGSDLPKGIYILDIEGVCRTKIVKR